MTEKKLYWIWAGMYVLCAAMGFLGEYAGAPAWLTAGTAVLFFFPPAWLLYRAVKRDRAEIFRRIRLLSLLSLGLTLAVILVNFFTFDASQSAGQVLYWLLILVSVPMVPMRVWAVSLFFWACLLMVCLDQTRKRSRK